MTKFKGTPIFGPDSSPSNSSQILSIIGTSVFWIIFFICMLIIKPKDKQPKFKEVQIVLSSTPIEKKSNEAPAPAAPAPAPATTQIKEESSTETPAPKVEKVQEQKPAPKKVEQKTTPKKTEEKKVSTKPAEPLTYAEDPMEAFNRQTATKTKKEFDWSQFDDEPEAEEKTTSSQNYVDNTVPAFEGSAATAATSNNKITSKSTESSTSIQSSSTSTTNALGKISNTKYVGNANTSVETESTVNTQRASGTGSVMMETSSGFRALIDPAEPVINLSEEAASTIDGSRKVNIQFKVVESGNVPRADIVITPASILSDIVKNEIINQISKWRFETADVVSIATFEYKIVKR